MGLRDRIFGRGSEQDADAAAPTTGTAGEDPSATEGPDQPTVIVPAAEGVDQPTRISRPGDAEGPAEAPDGHETPAQGLPQPGDEPQAAGETAEVLPPAEPLPGAPEGFVVDPAAAGSVPRQPGFRERGRLRRRVRYLREVRELGFRDLGGLVFDQHRFQRPNEALVDGKIYAIDAVDREIRAIDDALEQRTPYTELFIPGVSACQRCGALHASDARFCPQCGLAFSGPRAVAGMAPDQAAYGAAGAAPGQAALFDAHQPATPPAPGTPPEAAAAVEPAPDAAAAPEPAEPPEEPPLDVPAAEPHDPPGIPTGRPPGS